MAPVMPLPGRNPMVPTIRCTRGGSIGQGVVRLTDFGPYRGQKRPREGVRRFHDDRLGEGCCSRAGGRRLGPAESCRVFADPSQVFHHGQTAGQVGRIGSQVLFMPTQRPLQVAERLRAAAQCAERLADPAEAEGAGGILGEALPMKRECCLPSAQSAQHGRLVIAGVGCQFRIGGVVRELGAELSAQRAAPAVARQGAGQVA